MLVRNHLSKKCVDQYQYGNRQFTLPILAAMRMSSFMLLSRGWGAQNALFDEVAERPALAKKYKPVYSQLDRRIGPAPRGRLRYSTINV